MQIVCSFVRAELGHRPAETHQEASHSSTWLLLFATCRKLTVCLWKPDICVGASHILLSVQYFVSQKYSQERGEAHSPHCDGPTPVLMLL